jgi:signal transduction histidine kinase
MERHFQAIKRKISESNQIINNLLFYSRLRRPNLQKIEVHSILEECVNLEERKSSGRIKFTRKFDPLKDVFIEADGLQIQEVLSNLLGNAREAINNGQGAVEISAGHDASSVRVCIKDNGAGIPPECLEKIFDPFFTTKSNGTGLGLTVCYQIVTMHKGSISFTSEQGKGTVVEMILPKEGLRNG